MAFINGLPTVDLKKPLFSFGVITDVQYADIPDGHSFMGTPRYYRHSIQVLQRAVANWNALNKLAFSINFGDIIDGFCPKDQSLKALHTVISEFDKFNGPVHHLIGNHCLYNLPRDKLISSLKIPTNGTNAYYDFSPVPDYRFIVLDSYDISALAWPDDHPKRARAEKLLKERNPNENKNSPEGMEGMDTRFLMYNGGVGEEQLQWLDAVLKDCEKKMQKAVVCSHVPLDPVASSPKALLWNYEEVMEIVHRHGCVKVCISGHAHKGGYSVDSHGVHHRVLEAALECPPGADAFGFVDVYSDRLALFGTGVVASSEMVFM